MKIFETPSKKMKNQFFFHFSKVLSKIIKLSCSTSGNSKTNFPSKSDKVCFEFWTKAIFTEGTPSPVIESNTTPFKYLLLESAGA